jgi:hypothetical protein
MNSIRRKYHKIENPRTRYEGLEIEFGGKTKVLNKTMQRLPEYDAVGVRHAAS